MSHPPSQDLPSTISFPPQDLMSAIWIPQEVWCPVHHLRTYRTPSHSHRRHDVPSVISGPTIHRLIPTEGMVSHPPPQDLLSAIWFPHEIWCPVHHFRTYCPPSGSHRRYGVPSTTSGLTVRHLVPIGDMVSCPPLQDLLSVIWFP